MTDWRSSSKTSEARFRNRIPKMYSLNSEASMLASEDVSGGEEVTFELGEGEHVHTVGGGHDSTSGRCHPGLRFPYGPQPR